jgi:hypothetical protein
MQQRSFLMKKMNKVLGFAVIAAITLVALFAFSTTACSKSGGKDAPNSADSRSSPASAQASSAKPNPESDFEVKLTDDGKGAMITKHVGTSASVVIPATIQGMPVREIDRYAFSFVTNPRKAITSVVIPEGVTSISEGAFYECENLSSVTLPGTLTSIERIAFSKTALSSIKLPAGLTSLGDKIFMSSSLTSFPDPWPAAITTIPDEMFRESKLRGNLVIPESITVIGNGAFAWCKELTGVTLPSTIKVIEGNAFLSCTDLTTVDIPEKEIEFSYRFGGAFRGLPKLSLASQAALRQRGYTGDF